MAGNRIVHVAFHIMLRHIPDKIVMIRNRNDKQMKYRCGILRMPLHGDQRVRDLSDIAMSDLLPEYMPTISLKTCVEKRLTVGAPGAEMMKQVIEKNKEYLKNDAIEEYQQSLEDRLPQ